MRAEENALIDALRSEVCNLSEQRDVLAAELAATDRQVELLTDDLARSRAEIVSVHQQLAATVLARNSLELRWETSRNLLNSAQELLLQPRAELASLRAQRVPMTDDQAKEMAVASWDAREFGDQLIRTVERYHGIGAKP